MKILRILATYSPGFFLLVALLSVLGGASNAVLLGLISAELSGGKTWLPANLWTFLALLGLVFLTGYAARIATLHLANRSSYDLRVGLCTQILALPLRRFEEIGESRVFAMLTQDINSLGAALLKVPELLVSVSIAAGCLAYLAYLSPPALLCLGGVMVLLFVSYKLPMSRAARLLGRARELWDSLFQSFKTISGGFKELKLHAARRESFLVEDLQRSAQAYRQANFEGQHAYNLANSWGKILFLLFIGFLLYGIDRLLDLQASVLTAFVLTLLYMRESVVKILDVAPDLAAAKVAMKKIEGYGLSVSGLQGRRNPPAPPAAARVVTGPGEFRALELRGLKHRYYHEEQERDFTLGPIDLELNAGELVFVVGGNGSGKTTLAKVLTGLYVPDEGEILLNGSPISEENREEYRQLFTATFSDFFLFNRLAGLESEDLDERSRFYLAKLQLDHKVKVKEGRFSTTSLSQGQRKRLVLLTAYLEDRPIYVFDEWASDQDPRFKDLFYTELLPDLKRRGKTIIAISHDDRYYHLGDRVVKLENGQIVSDTAADEAPLFKMGFPQERPELVSQRPAREA